MTDKRKLFGTDGIRAVAGESPLDAKTIYAVGLALGVMVMLGVGVTVDVSVIVGTGLQAAFTSGGNSICTMTAAGLGLVAEYSACASVACTPSIVLLGRKSLDAQVP